MVAATGSTTENGNKNKRVAVDMRSDTVTQPSKGMRQAMADAEVGDDVFGDDPTVLLLEKRVAELLGKEAGLFVTSGTQGNLLAIATHCQHRGEKVICGERSHVFWYEQGGASSLLGVCYDTVPNQLDGTLKLDDIRSRIRGVDDVHFARAKLLCLENTQNQLGGKALPLEYMDQVSALCKEHGLALHIDGARLWNASVALGVPIKELVRKADTTTVCFSKGMGAPVGSVLVGPAQFIKECHRLRKAIGGGMRQVGVLAAAALYALDNNFQRLADDHSNAKRLAEGLINQGVSVVSPDSNIVFWDIDNASKLTDKMDKAGFRFFCSDGKRRCRAVMNLHVSADDVEKFLVEFAKCTKSVQEEPPIKKSRAE